MRASVVRHREQVVRKIRPALLAITGVQRPVVHVGRRTQEIGICMALGATQRDVLVMVLAQGLRLTVLGLAIGLAGTYAGARLPWRRCSSTCRRTIPRPSPGSRCCSPRSRAAAASLVPGLRATSVSPIAALRSE